MRFKLILSVVMLFALIGCAKAEDAKIGFNWKIDTAGKAAPILTYAPYQIDHLFGSNLDFQIWSFAGADAATGNLLGGGALVLHTPIAKNLWINLGIDCTFTDGAKPTWAGVIGFEILRF